MRSTIETGEVEREEVIERKPKRQLALKDSIHKKKKEKVRKNVFYAPVLFITHYALSLCPSLYLSRGERCALASYHHLPTIHPRTQNPREQKEREERKKLPYCIPTHHLRIQASLRAPDREEAKSSHAALSTCSQDSALTKTLKAARLKRRLSALSRPSHAACTLLLSPLQRLLLSPLSSWNSKA